MGTFEKKYFLFRLVERDLKTLKKVLFKVVLFVRHIINFKFLSLFLIKVEIRQFFRGNKNVYVLK